MSRLNFYLVRLQKASIGEIVHRIRERGTQLVWNRLGLLRRVIVSAPEVSTARLSQVKLPALERMKELSLTADILDGLVWSLGTDLSRIETFEKRWRSSTYTQVKQNPGDPDIRSVWEPARLQHLMYLLDACARESDCLDVQKVKKFCEERLLEWITENPFLIGPHYLSVMECGLRIPVFVYALRILDLSESVRQQILNVIYEHAWIIEQRFSLYSSLGNHTVAEALGLLVAGLVFQDSARGKNWYRKGKRYLEQECEREILEDGGPLEQSYTYHRFVLDLFSWGCAWMELNEAGYRSSMRPKLRRGEAFWSTLQQLESYSGFGDSDGGYAVAPGLAPIRLEPELLEPEVIGNWNLWVFEATGLTLCKHNLKPIILTFDHGPLGMSPLYNHGHADALSVTLAFENRSFFTDPGTYRYNGAPRHRRYFRGTSAHNTVTIDGKDQTEQLTGFVWKSNYEVQLEPPVWTEDSIRLKAGHKGYANSGDAVVHFRELHLNSDGGVDIHDRFEGSGHHRYSLNFHLDPQVTLEIQDDEILLDNQGKKLYVSQEQGSFRQVAGQEEPMLGWYSNAYGSICETTTMCCEAHGSPETVTFSTRIRRA